jgi:thiol-disulfide isomerase/thioredoxin
MARNLKANNFSILQNGMVKLHKESRNPGMLLIYANWCPHCVRFKPVFEDICMKVNKGFDCFMIEHSELENATQLTKALDFDGYPTLKFMNKNGIIIDTYPSNKERTASDILLHICKVYHYCKM